MWFLCLLFLCGDDSLVRIKAPIAPAAPSEYRIPPGMQLRVIAEGPKGKIIR